MTLEAVHTCQRAFHTATDGITAEELRRHRHFVRTLIEGLGSNGWPLCWPVIAYITGMTPFTWDSCAMDPLKRGRKSQSHNEASVTTCLCCSCLVKLVLSCLLVKSRLPAAFFLCYANPACVHTFVCAANPACLQAFVRKVTTNLLKHYSHPCRAATSARMTTFLSPRNLRETCVDLLRAGTSGHHDHHEAREQYESLFEDVELDLDADGLSTIDLPSLSTFEHVGNAVLEASNTCWAKSKLATGCNQCKRACHDAVYRESNAYVNHVKTFEGVNSFRDRLARMTCNLLAWDGATKPFWLPKLFPGCITNDSKTPTYTLDRDVMVNSDSRTITHYVSHSLDEDFNGNMTLSAVESYKLLYKVASLVLFVCVFVYVGQHAQHSNTCDCILSTACVLSAGQRVGSGDLGPHLRLAAPPVPC
jgi:hypothetical protein